MGSSKCVWRIHGGYSGDKYMKKEFTLNSTTLTYLQMQLDPFINNIYIYRSVTFRLEFVFPTTTSALKVKYQILIMKEEALLEYTDEVLLSKDACSVIVTKDMTVTKDKILDTIICIIKFDPVEEQPPSVPVTNINLGSLLTSDTDFTDVVLVSRDNCRFPAHKCVLAAHSPVFRAMFVTDMAEKQSGTVAISDLDGGILRRLLDFAYTSDINVVENDQVTASLFVAADKYAMDVLKKACEKVLAKQLMSAENVVDLLLLADAHGGEWLKERATDFIVKCGEKVIDSDKFQELKLSHPQLTIETLLTMLRK